MNDSLNGKLNRRRYFFPGKSAYRLRSKITDRLTFNCAVRLPRALGVTLSLSGRKFRTLHKCIICMVRCFRTCPCYLNSLFYPALDCPSAVKSCNLFDRKKFITRSVAFRRLNESRSLPPSRDAIFVFKVGRLIVNDFAFFDRNNRRRRLSFSRLETRILSIVLLRLFFRIVL